MKISKKIAIVLMVVMATFIFSFMQIRAYNESDAQGDVEQRLKDGIVLFVGSPISYVNGNKISIDQNDQDIYPIISNNRTIVPVRFLAEKLGATVLWDEKTQTATLSLNGKQVKLTLNSTSMQINNTRSELDVTPTIKNERMFVPVRAIGEAFDKKVFWDKGLIILSNQEQIFDISTERDMIDQVISKVNVLPTVETYDNLKKLLEKSQSNYQRLYGGVRALMAEDSIGITNTTKSESTVQNTASNEYSTTNVQVEGVDEADIVKTDGEYIYKISEGKVMIIKAFPSQNMSVLKTLSYDHFYPTELYVDSKHLVVIGNANGNMVRIMNEEEINSKMMIVPPDMYYRNTTKAIIYDITDKQNIKETRQIELEGGYVSSRKIDSSLYLVANKYVNYYYIQDYRSQDSILPAYRDTNIKDEFVDVECSKIQYLPNFVEPNYLIIGGIDLNSTTEVNISTYLGAGRNIYASAENLYVATEKYEQQETIPYIGPMIDMIMPRYYPSPDTLVYKFALNGGFVTFNSKGEVPGTILNQFSMDENNGYFRIATTKGNTWATDQNTSQNNLYVLNSKMSVVGQIENLAPGEKIYSVRFMGNRAYMVTFKSVDPLFVIDLSVPEKPNVLGALKIPGYSDYLHPYDENHIIGFGQDTIEVPIKDGHGNVIDTRVVNNAMKIALFDVSNVSAPKQMFYEKVGDAGTYSEVLNNHKALLYSKSKNIFAFPVEVRKSGEITAEGWPQYGEFAFQGAYVYSLDLEKGFVLKAKVSHYTSDEIKELQNGYYDYNKRVDRILYIDNTLYTLSNSMIKANDMNADYSEINMLKIN